MDTTALDKAMQDIVKRRQELATLSYSDPTYDDLEEKLHDLEDDFQDKFGDYLEEVLQNVHDEVCPDNDVLLPIAYIGKGVPVEVDKYGDRETKLKLEPNPPRIVLSIGKDKQEVIWTAK